MDIIKNFNRSIKEKLKILYTDNRIYWMMIQLYLFNKIQTRRLSIILRFHLVPETMEYNFTNDKKNIV